MGKSETYHVPVLYCVMDYSIDKMLTLEDFFILQTSFKSFLDKLQRETFVFGITFCIEFQKFKSLQSGISWPIFLSVQQYNRIITQDLTKRELGQRL